MLKVDHSFKSENYRTVLENPNLPVCQIFKDGKTNPLIQAFIDTLRPMAPDIFEICSRTGRIAAQNVTFANTAAIEMWPSGNYKVAIRFFDSLDDNIANISYTTTIY